MTTTVNRVNPATPRCLQVTMTDVDTWQVEHAATVYRIHTFLTPDRRFLLITGWNMHSGTWLALPRGDGTIAYSYLAEKLDLTEGDRAGWTMVLDAIGLTVR